MAVSTAGSVGRSAPGPARVALLIDADNVPADHAGTIHGDVLRWGLVRECRAYGTWESLKPWHTALAALGVAALHRPNMGGKNVSDMALVVDAVDLGATGGFDAFGLVSSEADLGPAAQHLCGQGLVVRGYGEAKAPATFADACTSFLVLGDVGGRNVVPLPTVRTGLTPVVRRRIREAVVASAGPDGWSRVASIGQRLKAQSIDYRVLGFSRLTALLQEVGGLDVEAGRARLAPGSAQHLR